jgi:hypothetical protein
MQVDTRRYLSVSPIGVAAAMAVYGTLSGLLDSHVFYSLASMLHFCGDWPYPGLVTVLLWIVVYGVFGFVSATIYNAIASRVQRRTADT